MEYCYNCFGERGGNGPCPFCGFDPSTQPQPGYALPWGTILRGKYLVGRMLGQGGFGITYVGWDLSLDVKVAIKEYYPTGQVSRQGTRSCSLVWNSTAQSVEMQNSGLESFLKEARKMARVDRVPQVVRVRETFHENDTAYIIMDFVQGETLKSRLEREGPLPFDRAMEVFRPAIAAMEEVHKAGLIHRDLSPDNIMLEAGGDVRILDLGAAKDLAVNRGATSMLVTKGGFSPLEQYSQRGGSGPWTDVYAMAATIYYTLTGVLPPNAIDRLDDDELRWDLPALEAMGAAKGALQRALAVAAKSRTQSMEELLAGLEQTGPAPVFQGQGPNQSPHPPKKGFWKSFWVVVLAIPVAIACLSILIGIWLGLLWLLLSVFYVPEPVGSVAATGAVVAMVVLALRKIMSDKKEAAWKLDDTGVLTLSGSGESPKKRPWKDRCGSITRIVAETGVTRIGDSAFVGCTGLNSVALPDSATRIGKCAFYGCTGLGSITIPKGVTEIGDSAFYGCTGLNSITIPESVAKIGILVFSGCISLTDVYYNGTEEQWRGIAINENNHELMNANIHYNG